MGDLPAKLEAKWKAEHEKSAEAEFARVAKEGQKSAGPSFFQKANAELSNTVLQAKKNLSEE